MVHPPPQPHDLETAVAAACDGGAAPQVAAAPEASGLAVREISPGDAAESGSWADLGLDAGPDAPGVAPGAASLPGEDERARAREAARASAIAALAAPRRERVPIHLLLVAGGFAALATLEIAYVVRAAPRPAPEPVFAVAHATAPAGAITSERHARRRAAPRSAWSEPVAAPTAPGGACPAPRDEASATVVRPVAAEERAPGRPEAAVDWSAPASPAPEVAAAPQADATSAESPEKASALPAPEPPAPTAHGPAEAGPSPETPPEGPAIVSASAR